jgi:hypothetical protein
VNLADYQTNPWPIIVFPGNYVLSANDTAGNPRPNGGRLELQPNMALCGTPGDRAAATIDASNLPASSYSGAVPNTGAIRMGNGDNAIEWLMVKKAVAGGAQIIVHRSSPGISRVRIAHVDSSGGHRGIDIRNVAAFQSGFNIEAEIVDNDLHSNRISTATGLRIINLQGSSTSVIKAKLRGNRLYDNQQGLIVENLGGTTFGTSSVSSNGDRFYENGGGATIGAGFGAANNNSVHFTAVNSVFENNNGVTNFVRGGLNVAGALNFGAPTVGANNVANVVLRNCHFSNNQVADLGAFGAVAVPVSAGLTATNNGAIVSLYNTQVPNLVTANSDPPFPEGRNFVSIRRSAPFDYDADGRSDVSVYRPEWSNYQWWISNSSTSSVNYRVWGEEDAPIVPADYDGDGKTDIAIVDIWGNFPGAARWWIHNSLAPDSFPLWGRTGDLFMPADYDGDGKADLAAWSSDGSWYIKQSSNGKEIVLDWGVTGDKPVPADYDGDGKTDLSIFRPSDGTWWTLNSNTGAVTIVQFGIATDKIAPADYTGDGRADIAVWRPSDGTWWVLDSTTGAATVRQWGLESDFPSPADYDGDGTSDFGIFRPSSGDWWILGATGSHSVTHWGSDGDLPTPSAYINAPGR